VPWLAATPPLATPFVFRDSGLRDPLHRQNHWGFDALAVVHVTAPASLAWAAVYAVAPPLANWRECIDENRSGSSEPARHNSHLHVAYDHFAVPLPWRLPSGTARFFDAQGKPCCCPKPRVRCRTAQVRAHKVARE